jgi:hypothetical protein
MIVYGSAIADGNRHTHEDLPILVAGKGWREAAAGTSLLDHVGVRPEKIGDSTGKLPYLAEL